MFSATVPEYHGVSRRFGFAVIPTVAALNEVAQGLAGQGKTDEAIELLRRAAREYRYIAATHRALGNALEQLGRREEALSAYEEGLRVALEDASPYGDPVAVYREKVKELR